MNCKQGDLAVIVRSHCGNEGRIVRCVEPAPAAVFGNPKTNNVECVADAWFIDPPVPGKYGGAARKVPDDQLRPIRDNPDQDETLTWAGKPQKEPA